MMLFFKYHFFISKGNLLLKLKGEKEKRVYIVFSLSKLFVFLCNIQQVFINDNLDYTIS